MRQVKEVQVVGIEEHSISIDQAIKLGVFDELNKMNVLTTNKCNLRCTYCYEQHTKNYGNIDLTKVKKLYDFLLKLHNEVQDTVYREPKELQFFGGEPLLHKNIILDFIRENKELLEANADFVTISITSNGTLVDEAFVEEYCSYPFTTFCMSLDTFDPTIDKRGADLEDLHDIIENVFPEEFKHQGRLSIRATLDPATANHAYEFLTDLYSIGVRNVVVHPLTFDAANDLVVWRRKDWDDIYSALDTLYKEHPEMKLDFAEGVGDKSGSNCLIASNMLAIDGSGEYTGCYFFTNNKVEASDTVLGNLFTDKIYINRYKKWMVEYDKSFDNEECKSCNVKDLCYSCPAGNFAVFNKPYGHYKFCKQITQFHVDLTEKTNEAKFKLLTQDIQTEYLDNTLSIRVTQLVFRALTGKTYRRELILKNSAVDNLTLPEALHALQNSLGHKDKIGLEDALADESLFGGTTYDLQTILDNLRKMSKASFLPADLGAISDREVVQLIYLISVVDMLLFDSRSTDAGTDKLSLKERVKAHYGT